MTEAEKVICKLYLEDLDKHHTCNEYKLLMQMLEQEPKTDVLDKIRAEIVDLGQRTMNDNRASGIWACRDIIDKYRNEQYKELDEEEVERE